MPNTIPVATAKIWVDRWRASTEVLDLKGFWVPGSDLTDVMKEPGVVDARTYLAIDDSNVFHLLIVGVDENGDDMLDPELGQYVYDFTQPCPATCSSTGLLK